jgi:hypothetical protein
MTTSVILVVQSKLILSFMVMIHCGMEQVVDLLMTAVNSTTLLWFLKQLPFPTTDDIEMRLCRSAADYEDTPVEIIELYIQ